MKYSDTDEKYVCYIEQLHKNYAYWNDSPNLVFITSSSETETTETKPSPQFYPKIY